MGVWSKVCGLFHKNENECVETTIVVSEQDGEERPNVFKRMWNTITEAPAKLEGAIVASIYGKVDAVLRDNKVYSKLTAVVVVLIVTLILTLVNTLGIVWLILKTTR